MYEWTMTLKKRNRRNQIPTHVRLYENSAYRMRSLTLETIFHEETRFSELTYVIGSNSPKEKRLNGEGKSIFSDAI